MHPTSHPIALPYAMWGFASAATTSRHIHTWTWASGGGVSLRPLFFFLTANGAPLSLPLKSRPDGQTAREGSPATEDGAKLSLDLGQRRRAAALKARDRAEKSGLELRRFIDECRSYSGPCSFRGSSITSLR